MDQSVFHLINEKWTSPALDLFMAALSDSEIWNPLLIAIVLSALFWRIQSAVVHGMLALVFAYRGAVYKRIKIGH